MVQIRRKLPIGISDYKKVMLEDYFYTDKTLLIKEFINSSPEVTLITRPRRFGKTLNLSMLHYFFDKSFEDNSYLFEKTAIWQEPEKELCGGYPVIYLSFKDVKSYTWEVAYKHLKHLIKDECIRHEQYISVSKNQQPLFNRIINEAGDIADYEISLRFLCELLWQKYKQPVIVLIDEYDTPITAAYHYGYYNEMIGFMRTMLTKVFKDNSQLYKGLLTGILRAAKEGIFSGLNNLSVNTLLSNPYSDKFGFTHQEVNTLLTEQNLIDKQNEVTTWYNGYSCGSMRLYNPWSIINCAHERGALKPYWVNTSDNLLIKKVIAQADAIVKSKLETIFSGESLSEIIDEGLVFPGIEKRPDSIWSLLLYAGYLTFKDHTLLDNGKDQCSLIIPNKEVAELYQSLMNEIYADSLSTAKGIELLDALMRGDAEVFAELFQEFVLNSMSVFDFAPDEPEKSYHLFVLGLLVRLSDSYEIKSNRESGYGRYDIMLIPRKKNKRGIIIEFKKVSKARKETLETAADNALQQIKDKKYVQELRDRGIKEIQALGIAFEGKQLFVKSVLF